MVHASPPSCLMFFFLQPFSITEERSCPDSLARLSLGPGLLCGLRVPVPQSLMSPSVPPSIVLFLEFLSAPRTMRAAKARPCPTTSPVQVTRWICYVIFHAAPLPNLIVSAYCQRFRAKCNGLRIPTLFSFLSICSGQTHETDLISPAQRAPQQQM
ncbi:hypothetical protein BC826DRAFT_1046155 [Russula brevipes]|nr:hypothetical protein BC826DRAFT_1046155 [Russula brevipes]